MNARDRTWAEIVAADLVLCWNEGETMKHTIDVRDRKEGDMIRAGLADPAVRAFVKIIAALNALPNDRARARVLTFVMESISDSYAPPEPVADPKGVDA